MHACSSEGSALLCIHLRVHQHYMYTDMYAGMIVPWLHTSIHSNCVHIGDVVYMDMRTN